MTMSTDPGEVTRARYDRFKSVTGASIGCSAGDLKNIDIATAVVESGGDSNRRRSLLATDVNGTNASYLWSTSFVAVSSLSGVGFNTGGDWALSMTSVLETGSFEVSLQEGLMMESVVVSDVVCIFLTNSPTQAPSPQPKPGSEPGAIANASTSFLLGVVLTVAMGVAGVVWALKRKKHPESGSGLAEDDWLSNGKSESSGKSSLHLSDPGSGGGVRTSRDLELVELSKEKPSSDFKLLPRLQNVADVDLWSEPVLAVLDDDEDEIDEGATEGSSVIGNAKEQYMLRLRARRAQSAQFSASQPAKDDDSAMKHAAMIGNSLASAAETYSNQTKNIEVEMVAQADSHSKAKAKAKAPVYGHSNKLATAHASTEHMTLLERVNLPEGVALIPPSVLSLKPKPFAKSGGTKLFKSRLKGRTVMAKRAIADDLDAFKREVTLLSSLPAHPHLLSLFGVAQLGDNSDGTSVDNSALYLIGGFCGRGTLGLQCRLASFGPLDFVRCVQQLLGALAHIHACSHWHGDLRPEHVLLDNSGAVRLTGFSSAEPFNVNKYLAKSDAAAPAGLSSRYPAPAYVPPEFWAAARETKSTAQAGSDIMSLEEHQQADVYAAAVTLWELWHKSEPFQGVAPRDVAERVRNGDRPAFTLPDLKLNSEAEVLAPGAPFKAPQRLTALVHASWAHAPASRLLAHGLHAAFTSRTAPAIKLAVEAESKQVLSAASLAQPGVLPVGAIHLLDGDHQSSGNNVPVAYTWRGGRPVFKGRMAWRPVAALQLRISVSSHSTAGARPAKGGLAPPKSSKRDAALDEAGLEVAQLAALATHPHVLTVYGVFAMATPLSWSAPELSEGADASSATLLLVTDIVMDRRTNSSINSSDTVSDLASYCRSGDQFTLAEFARVGRELLSGLAHLHAHGVAHGNLRPSTVLVERRHRHGYRVKLADYGVAALHSSPSAASDSKSGGAKKLGMFEDPKRVPYMSPEQFEARKAEASGDDGANKLAIARASDMYALGVTLWELWFRASPFAGLSRSQVVKHVCGGSRLPFQDVLADSLSVGALRPAPAMPEALSDLVKKCWAQVPTQRLLIDDTVIAFEGFCASIGQADGSQNGLAAVPGKPSDENGSRRFTGGNNDAAIFTLVERMDPEVQVLLHSARLWKYAPQIADLGFGDDLQLFNDQDLLDDGTLLGPGIGMSKLDIRRLRGIQGNLHRQANFSVDAADAAAKGAASNGLISGENYTSSTHSMTANRLQAKMREQEALEASTAGRLNRARPEIDSVGHDEEEGKFVFALGTGI
jgi:serine/threonine protein kinase